MHEFSQYFIGVLELIRRPPPLKVTPSNIVSTVIRIKQERLDIRMAETWCPTRVMYCRSC